MSLSGFVVLAFVASGTLFALSKRKPASASSYMLADRSLSGVTLFATLAASNLSAFTVFGVSGAAYRSGWAFVPVMAFGTGFMALSFVVFGLPMRRLSKERGWLTPGDCIRDRFQSPALGRVFSVLSLVYTVPYLAIQAGSGGALMAGATGLPRAAASGILVAVVAFYVFRGGMKAVARTDVLQLAVLVSLGLAAAAMVAGAASGSGSLAAVASDSSAALRDGADASLPWTALLGYYALWALADPMFPHFMQRFFAARSDNALLSSMALYPLMAAVVFFAMAAIGVMGRSITPGLEGSATDGVFTVLAHAVAGPLWGPVFSVAALAALMSTMDSQLLAAGSMLSGDVIGSRRAGAPAAVAALAVLAWLVSLKPPESILAFLNKAAFPGYASLAPVALAALYAPAVGTAAAMSALVGGASLVGLEALGVLVPPMPAAVFNALVQVAILGAGWLTERARKSTHARLPEPFPVSAGWLVVFGTMVILATDVWNFGRAPRVVAGLPSWLWYHLGLTLALGALFAVFARKRRS